MTTQELLQKAKDAKAVLAAITPEDIDRALLAMADKLVEHTDDILAETRWISKRHAARSAT